MNKSLRELVIDAKTMTYDEFKEANPGFPEDKYQQIYEPLRNSKNGHMEVEKISDNAGYILKGQKEWGYTEAFGEGISCYMSTPMHWFSTSIIQHIDWEKGEFTTMNSTYKFNFIPDENGESNC